MPRRLAALLALWLGATACAPVDFTRPGSLGAPMPATLAGYFAEFCALSQVLKRPGNGAHIRGEPGGHAVFYLHGACRAGQRGQTTLALCDEAGAEPADGVGLSMNAHFRNTKWVAFPGRDFFLHGNLPPEAPLTHASYAAVQAEAQRLGLYTGVEFHDDYFDDLPANTPREAWKYEISVATDYAISLGRGRVCARVPVNRAQLAAMVGFLNAENAPYRDGAQEFHWSLFQDNCIHLAHNALTASGLWPEWPMHRPWLLAMFNFPVPRNELVNLARHTADASLLNPARIHADPALRQQLMQFGQLPLRPGALLESRPPQTPNALYETSLTMLFFDQPGLGPYQGWYDALVADPSRHNPAEDHARVQAEYRRALAARRPVEAFGQDDPGFPATHARFYALLQAALAP